MLLVFDDRPSDSPFIERVWRSRSERAGTFLSVASPHWEMVVTRHEATTRLTLRGPETRVTEAHCPAGGEWIGIRFKLGTFMPRLPVRRLIDRNDFDSPEATPRRSFWLEGAAWEYPSFDNAESLVADFVKGGVIARDPAIEAALHGDPSALSRRSAQRHFLAATGMTHARFRQIARARYAAHLLKSGASITDTVHAAGYFDQPHLTRALGRWIGQTPARVQRADEPLSFLYKTALPR